MTANDPQKFLFDRDFSPEKQDQQHLEKKLQDELEAELAQTPEEEEIIEDAPPTYSEEDLQQARNEGFQAGHDQATSDLTGAIEQRLTATLENVGSQLAALSEAYQRDHEERSRDAVAVATVIVRKLFPALNMDNAMAEIEHMIVEAMNRTSGAPSFIIRVPTELRDAVEQKASEHAAFRGREGTITVMPDDTLNVGDAAVEWDGGGMVRDTKLLWQEIDEIIERNLGQGRANGAILTAAPEMVETPLETGENVAPEEVTHDITQEVVNDAPVGDNTQSAAESPDDSPQQAEMAETSAMTGGADDADEAHPAPPMEEMNAQPEAAATGEADGPKETDEDETSQTKDEEG